MIKNDQWIGHACYADGLINPYELELIRQDGIQKIISYGLSSYGYDIRLSPADFRVFRHIPGTVVDPKRFNAANLEKVQLQRDGLDEFFVLPAHSYGLGVALERLQVPDNVTGLVLNKSTYVRCGILMPTTVVEAGWKGFLTLEISNSSSTDARIYANEGIGQILFFEGEPCTTSYLDRDGKYQNQASEVTIAKV